MNTNSNNSKSNGVSILQVHECAVVISRDARGMNERLGNQFYYQLIIDNLAEYFFKRQPVVRATIRKRVVDEIIARGGKFYSYIHGDSLYYPMDDKAIFNTMTRRFLHQYKYATKSTLAAMPSQASATDSAEAVVFDSSLAKDATTNNPTMSDKLIVEKVEHPDGRDWSVESVTYKESCFTEELLFKSFLLVATIFQEISNVPDGFLKLYFHKFNTTHPYIKTRKLMADKLRLQCPSLALLIDSLDSHGIDCYFQFYTGVWHTVTFLTSIHQDGGDSHSRIWRILFRFFGATTVFNCKKEDDAFYSATCNMPRAIVATYNAFVGTLDDLSNNGVHHAASKDKYGLPGFVVMAETRGEVADKKSAALVVQAFEQTAELLHSEYAKNNRILPSLYEFKESLKVSDTKLFHPTTGRIKTLDPFMIQFERKFGLEFKRLKEIFDQNISGDFRYNPDESWSDQFQLAFPGSLNQNTDVLVANGGGHKFRSLLDRMPGNKMWRALLEKKMQTVDRKTMTKSEKGRLHEELVVTFHVNSGGGWFWHREKGEIIRITAAELVSCEGNSNPFLTAWIPSFLDRKPSKLLPKAQQEALVDHRKREREAAKSTIIDGIVDVNLMKTNDEYAMSILHQSKGRQDTTITIVVIRKIIQSVSGLKKLSKAQSTEGREKADRAIFEKWCCLHRHIRPHYFARTKFLVDLVVGRLDPPCDLGDKKICHITWIIIIVIFVSRTWMPKLM